MQREILVQRLGLAKVMQAVGGSVLSDVITRDDLLMTDHKSAKDDKKMLKRQRREDSQVHSGSIHALLVMEMQQQQDQTTERGATSHKHV